jgi:hypothetical protein
MNLIETNFSFNFQILIALIFVFNIYFVVFLVEINKKQKKIENQWSKTLQEFSKPLQNISRNKI